jgi:hypothetical protein
VLARILQIMCMQLTETCILGLFYSLMNLTSCFSFKVNRVENLHKSQNRGTSPISICRTKLSRCHSP